MRVDVAYATSRIEARIEVDLPAGSTVADAVTASGLIERYELVAAALSFGIHGQRASAATLLRDGDRVELLRDLVVDAKSVRRARAAAHPLRNPSARGRGAKV